MTISIVQSGDGAADLVGSDGSLGFLAVNIDYNAASVDKVQFVAPRAYVVKSIIARPTVAGTDAGAVTAVIKKAASGTAITAGTALHTGSYNLKVAADTVQAFVLSTTPSDLLIPANTCIGIDFTGVLTNATGVVTVSLAPA